MSDYIVIARKWRPQTFDEVIGQDSVIKTLKNAIGMGRVAHAFLFSGPRGVGKTSVARILAKALNCVDGPTPYPCGTCPNCREITDGISLDVREIDGASNRGIDEVRELREQVRYMPAACRYKIYIIDEVHMLTREAFNALLKTLEEPPPHVVFILATTETQKIPATILSRCQHFDFHRIPIRDIQSNLRNVASTEGITVSDTGLIWIAEAGDGSLRDAQSIFDQIIAYAGKQIADDQVEDLLGRTGRRLVERIARAVTGRDAAGCLMAVDEAYYTGMDMTTLHYLLLTHFRNLLIVKIVEKAEEILAVGREELSSLKIQAASVETLHLQRLLDILMEEEENIRRSLQPRYNLELTLVRMARLEPLLPIDEIVERLERLERKLASSEKTLQGSTSAHMDDEPVTPLSRTGRPPNRGQKRQLAEPPTEDVDQWESFKDFVMKKDHVLGSKLEGAGFLSVAESLVKIGVPENNLFLEDLVKDARNTLRALTVEFFGREGMVVEITPTKVDALGKNGGHLHEKVKAAAADIRREVLNSPAIQQVLDIFTDAEVREVIPRNPL